MYDFKLKIHYHDDTFRFSIHESYEKGREIKTLQNYDLL